MHKKQDIYIHLARGRTMYTLLLIAGFKPGTKTIAMALMLYAIVLIHGLSD
jgi:hypothetical protein